MAGNIYPLHLLYTTNYRLPGDVDRSNLERHMADADFEVYDYSYFYIKTNTNYFMLSPSVIYILIQFTFILDRFPDDAWGILYDTTLEKMRNQAASQPLLNIVAHQNNKEINRVQMHKSIHPFTQVPFKYWTLCINFILFHQKTLIFCFRISSQLCSL